MTRWTHAIRRPGPDPDRCTVDGCGCDFPDPRRVDVDNGTGIPLESPVCSMCDHELVPLASRPPSDVPSPRR